MQVQDMPRVGLSYNQGVAQASLSIPKILLQGPVSEWRLRQELEVIKNSSEVSTLGPQINAWYDGDKRSIEITIPANPFAVEDTVQRMMLLQHLGKRSVYRSFPLDTTNIEDIKRKVLLQ